jgi:hypothetical protein
MTQPPKRKSGNYLIKITRVNHDGSRDYLGMLGAVTIAQAKRAAVKESKQRTCHATIIDVFNHATVIYQYWNGRCVAWGLEGR